MAARGRRRLGRALVFIGVALSIPEFYFMWTLLVTLFTPIRAANGQLAQIHLQLNGSAWALLVVWTLLCAALMGWGLRILWRRPAS